MNLERYKTEMSRNVPDRKFVETTLDAIKNRQPRSKINKMQVLKTVGGVGLTAAVLCGAVIGGGAVRSLFEGIEPVETEQTTDNYRDEPVINEEKGGEIIATESELLVSPLASNPKYTLKTVTPDGQVSLNEDTTVEEMLACGVTVTTEGGYLGMEHLCKALRKQKNCEPFSFIFGDNISGNSYDYYVVNSKGNTDKYWEYEHEKYFYITKWVSSLNHFGMYETYNGEGGAKVSVNNTSTGLVTITDTLKVNMYEKEERKQMFFDSVTKNGGHKALRPVLGIKYNDKFPGAFRLNYFVKNIENGMPYVSVQFTDITTTEEYDECYYSIEYVNGIYSIFTMKDGFNGTFDTQYFDGYTVSDNVLTFNNGIVCYSFRMSDTPEADYEAADPLLRVSDSFMGYGNDFNAYDSEGKLDIPYDNYWFENATQAADLKQVLVINEEYSTEDVYACEVNQYTFDKRNWFECAEMAVNPMVLGIDHNGGIYEINRIIFYEYCDEKIAVPMLDGKYYLMLDDEQINMLKKHRAHIHSKDITERGIVYSLEYNVHSDEDIFFVHNTAE